MKPAAPGFWLSRHTDNKSHSVKALWDLLFYRLVRIRRGARRGGQTAPGCRCCRAAPYPLHINCQIISAICTVRGIVTTDRSVDTTTVSTAYG